MTAPTTTPAAQAFLAAVEEQLADLPADERGELLEDLALHLSELEGDGDGDGDGRSLASRLGPAVDYAAELRAAAGLPPRAGAPSSPRPLQILQARALRAHRSRAAREVRDLLVQLRPAWWVLRGYLVVLLPALRPVNGRHDFPIPYVGPSRLIGLVLVAGAIVLSVALGRRRLPRPATALVVVLNVALALSAYVTVRTAGSRLTTYVGTADASAADPFTAGPLLTRHGPVTDVFPYAADGTPLTGVLLFDQDGRPLRVAQQLWWPDRCRRVLAQPRAKDGVPVPFSYPQQYLLDPSGQTLDGTPAAAGQCQAAVARPQVPLPAFAQPLATPAAKATTR